MFKLPAGLSPMRGHDHAILLIDFILSHCPFVFFYINLTISTTSYNLEFDLEVIMVKEVCYFMIDFHLMVN